MIEETLLEEQEDIPVNDWRKNKLILIMLIAVPIAALLVFLLYKYLAPFGKAVSYKFTSKLPGAQEATTFPASKDNLLTIPSQIIRTPQVKFAVNLLSPNVNSIHAKLRFKKNTKEIKIGVRGNETDSFIYRPLYRAELQDLSWPEIAEGDFTLWQKEKTFSKLGDFVKNVSPDKKIAAYFADVDKLSLFKPSEVSKDVTTMITNQLRGTHTLLVRVDKAPLILKVTKQDLNAYDGEDKVKVAVSKDGKTIGEQSIPDDGIATASNLKMQPQSVEVIVKDIKQGLYQIDLIAEGKGGDSLISKIEVNQQKLVFKNYIFIVGNKPSIFWTDAKNINITTVHESGKQTVKLNSDIDLKISEVNKKYTFDLKELSGKKDSSLYQLEFPENDLVVNYEGYIALNKESYFYPEIIQSVPLASLETLDDIDYFLTTYQKAKQDGDWMVAEAAFDPKDVKVTGDKLYFSLEMPDFAKYGGELEIDSLEIEAKSDGILSKAGKEKKEEAAPVTAEGKKPTIFSRFFGWVNKTTTSVKNAIVSPVVSAWNAMRGFFGGIVAKFPGKKPASPTPSPAKPSPSTSPKPTAPTATPSATPSAARYDLLIRVLNGGSEKGSAASVAAILKTNGFTNVKAENADRFDYAGVTIRHRKEDGSIADRIEGLLKKEYGTVTKTLSATTTAEAVVILGKK